MTERRLLPLYRSDIEYWSKGFHSSMFLLFILCLIFIISCSSEHDDGIYDRLLQWDSLLHEYPDKVQDSLLTLCIEDLSQTDLAYYNLLKTIADDKTYIDFTSDSLINRVERFYRKREYGSNLHIRALIYQGVVRLRMDIIDSTVYQPLKEAVSILDEQKAPDCTSLYYANYFIGDIHKKNGNNDLAEEYIQKALSSANLRNDSSHIFDAYLALFWNSLQQ